MNRRRTPRQKNANSAMKLAVSRTEKKLAPKARKKVVVTYPKGLYRSTLQKELCIANKEVGLGNGCKAAKPKPTRKRVTGKAGSTRKRSTSLAGSPKAKKATTIKKKSPSKKKAAPKKKGFLGRVFG